MYQRRGQPIEKQFITPGIGSFSHPEHDALRKQYVENILNAIAGPLDGYTVTHQTRTSLAVLLGDPTILDQVHPCDQLRLLVVAMHQCQWGGNNALRMFSAQLLDWANNPRRQGEVSTVIGYAHQQSASPIEYLLNWIQQTYQTSVQPTDPYGDAGVGKITEVLYSGFILGQDISREITPPVVQPKVDPIEPVVTEIPDAIKKVLAVGEEFYQNNQRLVETTIDILSVRTSPNTVTLTLEVLCRYLEGVLTGDRDSVWEKAKSLAKRGRKADVRKALAACLKIVDEESVSFERLIRETYGKHIAVPEALTGQEYGLLAAVYCRAVKSANADTDVPNF